MVGRFPFEERASAGDVRVRTFAPDVDDEELVWHRDSEDRTVHVLEGMGWFFQRDGDLPIPMRPGDVFEIEKKTWHRVVKKKGAGSLVVEVILRK